MDSTRVPTVRQDGHPTERWTRLPDALLAELTPREHQLVHLLLSYRWTDDAQIYPYVGTLAKRLDCSKRTIQRTLSALVERGYIVVVARYRDEGDGEHHGQTSNIYAPGPMLLPLLPRDRDEADAGAEQDRQTPMTRTADRKKYRNYKTERKTSNVLQAGQCAGCGSREHLMMDCPEYGWLSKLRT